LMISPCSHEFACFPFRFPSPSYEISFSSGSSYQIRCVKLEGLFTRFGSQNAYNCCDLQSRKPFAAGEFVDFTFPRIGLIGFTAFCVCAPLEKCLAQGVFGGFGGCTQIHMGCALIPVMPAVQLPIP
jgi:hypothetical protein